MGKIAGVKEKPVSVAIPFRALPLNKQFHFVAGKNSTRMSKIIIVRVERQFVHVEPPESWGGDHNNFTDDNPGPEEASLEQIFGAVERDGGALYFTPPETSEDLGKVAALQEEIEQLKQLVKGSQQHPQPSTPAATSTTQHASQLLPSSSSNALGGGVKCKISAQLWQ